jgi:acetyl-CoA carboxylase carboxyltransferase component
MGIDEHWQVSGIRHQASERDEAAQMHRTRRRRWYLMQRSRARCSMPRDDAPDTTAPLVSDARSLIPDP